jgi:TolA-binding protein
MRLAWLTGAAALMALAGTAKAQDSTVQEIRLRQLEADVRALQRQTGANPGSVTGGSAGAPTGNSGMGDVLARLDAIEAQLARLTAQTEELTHHQHDLEARLNGGNAASAEGTPPPPTALAPPPPRQAVASAPLPALVPSAPPPSTPPARASAQRVAAVKAVVKPATGDAGEDDYSYGFRLYDAKFYPEAEQQLKMYLEKYPRHAKVSYARNLLGRAFLDDGKPRDAAPWFLQNYKVDPQGPRAADSLLGLAESMKQIGDSSRACIALGEFSSTYSVEAKGRLRASYETTRKGLSCS